METIIGAIRRRVDEMIVLVLAALCAVGDAIVLLTLL